MISESNNTSIMVISDQHYWIYTVIDTSKSGVICMRNSLGQYLKP